MLFRDTNYNPIPENSVDVVTVGEHVPSYANVACPQLMFHYWCAGVESDKPKV